MKFSDLAIYFEKIARRNFSTCLVRNLRIRKIFAGDRLD